MKLYSSPVSSAPHQYVADDTDLSQYPRFLCPDQETAVSNVLDYLHDRVTAVLKRDDRRPYVMLSGGIDSILLAAVVSKVRPDALAVTVHFEVPSLDSAELDNACAAAQALSLEHLVVRLGLGDITRFATQVVQTLKTADVWEVLAGIVLQAGDESARNQGADGAIFTGAGADAVFLGGDSTALYSHWHESVEKKIADHFIRERVIPDFYERILYEPDRHIQAWQTVAAVELAFALRPEDVRGENFDTDKRLLREAAVQAGLPKVVTTREKDPMQVSSGGVEGLVLAARAELANDPMHAVYADPLLEPLEHTVSRLWLNGKL